MGISSSGIKWTPVHLSKMEACEDGVGLGISESFPHDTYTHAHAHSNLADTIYGILPARALDLSSADIRAPSLSSKRYQDAKTSCSSKRKGTHDSEHIYSRPSIFPPGYWSAPKGGKRTRLDGQKVLKNELRMELHQSTCLNLNLAGSDDSTSDLWILPDFEEWEADAEGPEEVGTKRRKDGDWAPLVERAVNSNRERLRRRLEGDGWDFVGGRYGEDANAVSDKDTASEESVDEEFDVVVLPVVEVS